MSTSSLSNSTTIIQRHTAVPKFEKLLESTQKEKNVVVEALFPSGAHRLGNSTSPMSSPMSSPHSPPMTTEDHLEAPQSPMNTTLKRDNELKDKDREIRYKRAVPNWLMGHQESRVSQHAWQMESEEEYQHYYPPPHTFPKSRHTPPHHTLAPIGKPMDFPFFSTPRHHQHDPHFNQSDYQVAQALFETSRGSRGSFRPDFHYPYEECHSFEYTDQRPNFRPAKMEKQQRTALPPPAMRDILSFTPRTDPFYDTKSRYTEREYHTHHPVDTRVPSHLLQAEYSQFRSIRSELRHRDRTEFEARELEAREFEPRRHEVDVDYVDLSNEDSYYHSRREPSREYFHDQRARAVPRASFSPPMSPALSPNVVAPVPPFFRHDMYPIQEPARKYRKASSQEIRTPPSPHQESHLVPTTSPCTPPPTPSSPAPSIPVFTIENFNLATDGSKLAPHPKNPVKFEFKDFKENEYHLHSMQNSAGGSTLLTLKQQKRHKRIINKALAQGQARQRAMKAAEEAKKAESSPEGEIEPPAEQKKTNKRKARPTEASPTSSIKKEATSDEQAKPTPQKSIDSGLHCICKKPETDSMVQCDSCDQWYHFECVGLTESAAQDIVNYNCMECKGSRSFSKKSRDEVDESREESDIPSTSSSPANVPDETAILETPPQSPKDARLPSNKTDSLEESDGEDIDIADGVISISSLAKQPWLDGWVTARGLAVRYLMEAKKLGYEITENRRLPKQIAVRMSGKGKRAWRQAEVMLAVQFLKVSDLVETSTKKGTIVRESCKTMDDLISKVQSIPMSNSNNIGKLRVVEFARTPRGEEKIQ